MLRRLTPMEVSLAVEGQDWGDCPSGELPIIARDVLRSRPFLGQPKMAVHTLNGRKNISTPSRSRRKSMRSYMDSSQSLIATRTLRLGPKETTVLF